MLVVSSWPPAAHRNLWCDRSFLLDFLRTERKARSFESFLVSRAMRASATTTPVRTTKKFSSRSSNGFHASILRNFDHRFVLRVDCTFRETFCVSIVMSLDTKRRSYIQLCARKLIQLYYTQEVIPMADIRNVEKKNTAVVFPNAIQVQRKHDVQEQCSKMILRLTR